MDAADDVAAQRVANAVLSRKPPSHIPSWRPTGRPWRLGSCAAGTVAPWGEYV
jgi:hypothetical protein